MNDESLRDTIEPKSDQLNADDLLCGPITVTVTSVTRGDREQPVVIHLDGGYRPYKPCKSMRRVLIAAWGDKGSDWVGRKMTLYNDPEVMFGGVKVGGIRISHLSHIEHDLKLLLTTTRSKRAEYYVQRLDTEYPPEKFAKLLPEWRAAIAEGRITVKELLEKIESRHTLTSEQRRQLLELEPE